MATVPEEKFITDSTSALSSLSIKPQFSQKDASESGTKQNTNNVSESWEDENISSGDEVKCPQSPQQTTMLPLAPPPTPISPATSSTQFTFDGINDSKIGGISNARDERCVTIRPDKTDAIAKRMISSALGIKPRPKTEEEKVYESAMKEKAIKRRNQEKQALIKIQEEIEHSKQAVWND